MTVVVALLFALALTVALSTIIYTVHFYRVLLSIKDSPGIRLRWRPTVMPQVIIRTYIAITRAPNLFEGLWIKIG